MPKLAELEVERNQEKIEQAALRLFIQRGFYGTSVRDIAERAGVSLGNIYNYYPTKEDLFARPVFHLLPGGEAFRWQAAPGISGTGSDRTND